MNDATAQATAAIRTAAKRLAEIDFFDESLEESADLSDAIAALLQELSVQVNARNLDTWPESAIEKILTLTQRLEQRAAHLREENPACTCQLYHLRGSGTPHRHTVQGCQGEDLENAIDCLCDHREQTFSQTRTAYEKVLHGTAGPSPF